MKPAKTNQVGITDRSPEANENRRAHLTNMEAIARGVQVRLDERTCFSRRVTDETVNTARALGVADSIIERWAAQRLNRLAQETERLREIRALLERCRRERPETAARTRA
jgi:hypothetical protein